MQVLPGAPGARISALRTMYPSSLEVATGEVDRSSRETSTIYGYVLRGSAKIFTDLAVFELREGGYFAVPGGFVAGVDGVLVLIERIGFLGMLVAGALEHRGRLSYIDGCSDSILVAPPRSGDPVLNHLHFPLHTDQSFHAHPSIRLGVVARGSGVARTVDGELPLRAGDVFLLPEHEVHAFRTSDTTMDVIAFHPDSDQGPTDAAHPMINRTYLSSRAMVAGQIPPAAPSIAAATASSRQPTQPSLSASALQAVQTVQAMHGGARSAQPTQPLTIMPSGPGSMMPATTAAPVIPGVPAVPAVPAAPGIPGAPGVSGSGGSSSSGGAGGGRSGEGNRS